jgi:hypothetical protein
MSSVMRFDEWQDSNGVPVLDGTGLSIPSSALPTGSILQVVSTTKTDTQVSTSIGSGTTVAISGLSASITPSSTSSKIFVTATISATFSVSSSSFLRSCAFQILRDGSVVGVGDAAGSRSRVSGASGQVGTAGRSMSQAFLDSPASISALTYTVNMVNIDDQTATIYVNRGTTDSDNSGHGRNPSTITLMEVAG